MARGTVSAAAMTSGGLQQQPLLEIVKQHQLVLCDHVTRHNTVSTTVTQGTSKCHVVVDVTWPEEELS